MSGSSVFDDMLVGHEQILGILSAPGPRENKQNTWWQVALTQHRVLVVQMAAADGAQNWVTTIRQAAERGQVQMGQFPNTPQAKARVEVYGFPQPVVLVDVDDPQIHPTLATWWVTWGQAIHGSPQIPVGQARVPEVVDGDAGAGNNLLLLMGGGAVILVFCCGAGTILSLIARFVSGAM